MLNFKDFMNVYGPAGLVRFVLFPLTSLVMTPLRLIQSLWDCRILFRGKWHQYAHFYPPTAFNYLFYWNASLQLKRFGKTGTSAHVGLGHYDLSQWYQYHFLPSLPLYYKAGAVTLLAGMFGWCFAHLLWVPVLDFPWLFAVMFLALASTTFYTNLLCLQNYNVLGWMFFPVGIYGLLEGHWLIAAAAWLLAGWGSFTVMFLAILFSFATSLVQGNAMPLFAALPAVLKCSMHFLPAIASGNPKTLLLNSFKALGIIDSEVKYKRVRTKSLNIKVIYYLLLYGQFLAILYVRDTGGYYLFVTALLIFLCNSLLIRFADIQSMAMMTMTIATAIVLKSGDPWLLPGYWLLISPLPLMTRYAPANDVLDVLPRLRPFSMTPFIERMERFFDPVSPEKRILMALKDPEDIWENLFYECHGLLPLVLYVAAVRRIHLMPDWWAVFETNHKDAPGFWGESVDSVLKNIRQWHVDYVIIQQKDQPELDQKWQDAGFQVLSHFSWQDEEATFCNMKPYRGTAPEWWLLQPVQETK